MDFSPNLTGLVPPVVEQTIRTLLQSVDALNREVTALKSAPKEGFDPKSLQAGGKNPLNMSGLAGVLAQPQVPMVSAVDSLPPNSSPLSQDGVLVSLALALYRFNGGTKTWEAIV